MSIRRHTLYNLAGQFAPLVLALATIPALLGLIGEARYGVLVLVWLLVGYLGLFDLGLGPATAQRLARTASDSTEHARERATVVWTSLTVNLTLGVCGALLAWPIASYFFGQRFGMDEALRAEVLLALPWMALAVPVATVSSVLVGALQARHRFGEINLVNAIGQAGVQVLPLLVAWKVGPSLSGLVQAVLAARLLTACVLLQQCRRLVVPNQPARWNTQTARDLLGFGGWVTVTAVIGPMMVILDRFAIGWLFGARAVSHYTIPFQLAERVTMLSSSLNFALFPRLAADQPEEERQALGQQALRVLVLLLSPLVAAAVLLIGPFLAWWISDELAAAAMGVAQVLFLGFWINSLALVPFTQLQAAGRPDLVAKCHALELLPYLALLYLGLQQFGLMGAALVFCARAAVDFVLLAKLAGGLKALLPLIAWPALVLMLLAALAAPGMAAHAWSWVLGAVLWLALLGWCVKQAPPGLLVLLRLRPGATR